MVRLPCLLLFQQKFTVLRGAAIEGEARHIAFETAGGSLLYIADDRNGVDTESDRFCRTFTDGNTVEKEFYGISAENGGDMRPLIDRESFSGSYNAFGISFRVADKSHRHFIIQSQTIINFKINT